MFIHGSALTLELALTNEETLEVPAESERKWTDFAAQQQHVAPATAGSSQSRAGNLDRVCSAAR